MLRKPDLKLKINVDVFGFRANEVKCLQDYYDILADRQLKEHLVYHDIGHNLVTNTGLNQIGNLITGVNTNSYTYNGVGSSASAASATDTDLLTAIGSRVAITNRYVSSNVAHLDTFYNSVDNNGTWNETIIATASSGANAGARRVLATTFTKSAGNTATIAWSITLTAV